MNALAGIVAFALTIIVSLPYYFSCHKGTKPEEKSWKNILLRVSDLIMIVVTIILCMNDSENLLYGSIIIGIVCGHVIRFLILGTK
jgi:hypothetical protein